MDAFTFKELTAEQVTALEHIHDAATVKEYVGGKSAAMPLAGLRANLPPPQSALALRCRWGPRTRRLEEYLGNPTDDVLSAEQREILLDMHLYNLAFCKECGFSAEKTSVFFAVVKRVLELDFATNDESIATSFARFKTMVLQHAVQRSPVRCVSPDLAWLPNPLSPARRTTNLPGPAAGD